MIKETQYKLQPYLSPTMWGKDDEGEIKLYSKIRLKLLKIANQFYKDLKIKARIEDIIFTGSMAGYNYVTSSDIDLHIVVNFDEIDENTELVSDWLLNKGGRWNEKHNVELKSHPVEIYVQNAGEDNITGGMYSIFYDTWIKFPEKEETVEYNQEKVIKITNILTMKIDEFERFLAGNRSNEEAKKLYDAAVEFKDNIRKYRQKSLSEEGIYSTGNLVFKQLRNNEYLKKLSDIVIRAYDLMFLEERKEN